MRSIGYLDRVVLLRMIAVVAAVCHSVVGVVAAGAAVALPQQLVLPPVAAGYLLPLLLLICRSWALEEIGKDCQQDSSPRFGPLCDKPDNYG